MSFVLPSGITAAQAAIWLDQHLFVGKPIYNTGQVLTIRGPLDVDLFEKALREAVAESPGLWLAPRSGPVPFDLALLDFREERDPLAAADQWMRSEMGKAIPLEDPALFRVAAIRIGDDHTLWFQKFHHIIMDATSRRLLSERTAHHYRALRFNERLPALDAITPQELLDAERRYTASKGYEGDRAYWLEQLAHWPGPLLETNREKTERARSGRHARNIFKLKRSDFGQLEAVARGLGSSTFRAIIALSYVAFARVYDRYDILLGLELANRPDARTKQAVGYIARPLPMLLNLDPSTTIADAVRQIDEIRARSYPHRHFPVEDIARELGITRKGHHGLFDVIINYVPVAYDFAFEDAPVEVTNLSSGFTVPWTITITDTGSARDLNVTIDSDPGLIPADLAGQLASCVETLLLQGLDDPDCPLGSLPILQEATRAQISDFAAGETVALPDGATLATLCAAQAERTPNAIALICGEQQLTFATLHEQATRLARQLAALGVRPGVVVGIALPRTPGLLVAVLAVHKAGGAYLALDPSYPAERIRFIVADAAAPVIITTATLAPIFAESGARLLLDTQPEAESELAEPVPAGPNDLAYVLYTSGSTGRPKAAGIEHRNLINLIFWGRSIVSDAELRGLLFSTSLNFDLSAFEMFLPLVFGGCIVMVESLLSLQSAPQRENVRLINTGPSLFEALLRAHALPSGVTTVILAGEKLSRHLASSIFDAAPKVRLLNCYGPTETTVYSSWACVDFSADIEPTIGQPIWNTTLYVLDRGGALLPVGADGELFIGGAGVARGYLGRPELTAERFLPNPHGPGQLYRTGDRVRWLANGELEFLGRADNQMKINGIRVEPGEIEATLLSLSGIAAAVVTLYEDPAGVPRLVGYLVGKGGAAQNTDNVRAALERQLPRNMVPTYFVWLDKLPLTPNGKLDRRALPLPAREATQPPADRPPQTDLEREVAEIWEDLLQVSPIGVHSDFFDLGGDSLALVSLFATIEARFGRHLTVDVLAGGLTIAGMARLLAGEESLKPKSDPVVALQPHGHLPPFFCVHGIGGDVMHLQRLAVHMGNERPFLGIRRTSDSRPTDTINQIAARYVDAILVHQPAGPFYLGGHSFGATVAYEMAVQLVERGHEVGLLAIIDQRKPGWRLRASTALPHLHKILAKLPGRLWTELVDAPAPERAKHMRRTVLRWSKLALGYPTQAVTMFDLSRSNKEQVEWFEAGLKSLRTYRPKPLRAPITLFRADVQLLSHLALDSTLGWGEVTQSEIKVRVVPGSHRSIATEPLVRHLAASLSDELDVVQRSQ